MTGGCSARADVPITACQHEGLNDKVRTLEIKIGIFLIYVALALNLVMLTVGQVCSDEVSRLRWPPTTSWRSCRTGSSQRSNCCVSLSLGGACSGRHNLFVCICTRTYSQSDTRCSAAALCDVLCAQPPWRSWHRCACSCEGWRASATTGTASPGSTPSSEASFWCSRSRSGVVNMKPTRDGPASCQRDDHNFLLGEGES